MDDLIKELATAKAVLVEAKRLQSIAYAQWEKTQSSRTEAVERFDRALDAIREAA